MTLNEAKQIAQLHGYNLKFIKDTGEYRAAPNSGTPQKKEAQAYYTDSLDDAVGTVLSEARRRDRFKTVRGGDVRSHSEFSVAL